MGDLGGIVCQVFKKGTEYVIYLFCNLQVEWKLRIIIWSCVTDHC
jgi:hypothetical protein